MPEDVNQYGFTRWDPQDAGANQTISEEGGGIVRQRRALHELAGNGRGRHRRRHPVPQTVASQSQPFFMVISLVNPHDVLLYPKNYTTGGYDDSWLQGEIDPPATANEDLSTKPSVQAEFLRSSTPRGRSPRLR